MPSPSSLQPRICHIVRSEQLGYGFHLYGGKSESGHFIKKVEDDSPASLAGLRTGDRIVAVNGENVQDLKHAGVVAKIKQVPNETTLLVIDLEGLQYSQEHNIKITEDLINKPAPSPAVSKASSRKVSLASSAGSTKEEPPQEPQQVEVVEESKKDDDDKPRPRLCNLVKGDAGFGFNLHSEKGSSGKTVSYVDPDGPAFQAGLRLNDRVVEVNGVNMENERHSKVVAQIKQSGDQVQLLVVDPATDNYYLACHVTPNSTHVTGEVPTKPANPGPSSAGTSGDNGTATSSSNVTETTEFTDAILSMDLSALKDRVSSKKKKAPSSAGWGDRKAIFNNF